jgi:His/Glu/Gln/Arg/opine family amino acid ABC transporter permease subunit
MFAGFDLGIIWKSTPDLLHGLAVTLQLTLLTVLGGILLSIPLGVLRASRHRSASGAIWLYTYFFRGTPMLVQLYLIYYGLGQFAAIRDSVVWPVLSQAYWCCLLTFTLNTAAYTIEIVAGAIRNVPHADIETAYAHGMSRWTCLRRITLPVAFRIVLPAYTNEVIFILQSSSLASIVTVLDLTGVARTLIARTFASYEFYITIGLVYLALTYLMLWGFRRIERLWYRHLDRMPMASRDGELALR